MKKHIFLVMALVAAMSLNAQEHQYKQKLDSVVGSNDFDWTRWKNVYTYTDSSSVATSYIWENQAWVPGTMIETIDETHNEKIFRLTEEGWELYSLKTYWFLDDGDLHLIVSEATETFQDTAWVGTSYSTYDYDEHNHLTLNMNYLGVNEEGNWIESSKYEYSYNEAGLVDTSLYSTIRNGNWRESQRNLYSYDDAQQCTTLVIQTKGGWGPGANQWRDVYRYEFEYENNELQAEYCYVAQGWFGGGDMALDSKWEYEYDANGNLLKKTGSVFNEVDWIVRDVYENRFETAVDANTVKGLEAFWQSLVKEGMGYTLGGAMPLKSQWLSCSIITADRDTEFTLYCSGFEGVDEEQMMPLKAWTNNGHLVVTSEQPADIVVFDLLGRVVASEKQTQQCQFDLTPGLYIVGNGNVRVKVVVK